MSEEYIEVLTRTIYGWYDVTVSNGGIRRVHIRGLRVMDKIKPFKQHHTKCNLCEGTGVVYYKKEDSTELNGEMSRRKCYKCKGEGQFDWIENIVGKK